MIRISVLLLLIAVFVGFSYVTAHADTGIMYKEVILLGGYSRHDDVIFEQPRGLKNAVGFEYLKKVSNEYGDVLTLDLQARLHYDSSRSHGRAFAVEVHNAWLDYKVGLGRTLRVGHFDPSFGLEPLLDTHATLVQTLAMQNIGYKKDWGVGFRSYAGPFDYSVALQLGSGMGIRHKDDSYLLTGRIGTPDNADLQYGLSLMIGNVLRSKEMKTIPRPDLVSPDSMRKRRVGVDMQYTYGPWQVKGECAVGDNNGVEVYGALGEIDMIVPVLQELTFQLQGSYWSNNIHDNAFETTQMLLGAEYKVNSYMTIRSAYTHDFTREKTNADDVFLLQCYLLWS